MVGVFATQVVDVQRDKGVVHKALEELMGQLAVKRANHAAFERHVHDQTGATGQVDYHARQRFIQRHVGVAVTADAFFISHRLVHGLAEGNAHVFHRVVAINVQVAHGLNVEVDQAMPRDLIEHVVKKADTGMQLGLARAV